MFIFVILNKLMNNDSLHKDNNLIKIIIPGIFNESDYLYDCVLNKKMHNSTHKIQRFMVINKPA
jgi:hypothetical protein